MPEDPTLHRDTGPNKGGINILVGLYVYIFIDLLAGIWSAGGLISIYIFRCGGYTITSTQKTRKESLGRSSRRELQQAEEVKWAFDKQVHRTVIIRRRRRKEEEGGGSFI